jgi:hypothetical protein
MRDLFDLIAPYPGLLQIRLVGDVNAHGQVVVTAKMQDSRHADTEASHWSSTRSPRQMQTLTTAAAWASRISFCCCSHWGACDPCIADLDCNGQVDVVDFFAVLQDWGSTY